MRASITLLLLKSVFIHGNNVLTQSRVEHAVNYFIQKITNVKYIYFFDEKNVEHAGAVRVSSAGYRPLQKPIKMLHFVDGPPCHTINLILKLFRYI